MITSLEKSKPKKSILTDKHGRFMRKLRVSLTDACNFRCFYCMPVNSKFMPKNNYLSIDQIYEICKNLVELGVSQIRITGGEPTMRKNHLNIIQKIGTLPIKKFGLTTNGWNLIDCLPKLQNANCKYINVSLDSLNEKNFNKITHSKNFNNVINGIIEAKKIGINIKINKVLLRGINDHETTQFIEFSAKHNIPVRFLEMMKIGQVCNLENNTFISADEIIKKINKTNTLTPIKSEHDSTSFNFTTNDGAKIGFIASETQAFCNSCSRLRLTASGKLRACLMSEHGLNLKNIPLKYYPDILKSVISMKPNFRLEKVEQNMNQIGG